MPREMNDAGKILIAITMHFWGSGKTEKDALSQLKREGGSTMLASYGYIVVETDDADFRIDEIDGGVLVHDGKTAKIVNDRRKVKGAIRRSKSTESDTDQTGTSGKVGAK